MQASDKPRHAQRVAIILVVVVGVIATAVAYLGTREEPHTPGLPASAAPAGITLPVEMIVLPHDEPELPPGPHRTRFRHFLHDLPLDAAAHDPTAVPPKDMEAVVDKMVKTYGAPIAQEAQEQIVDYLMTVRGLKGQGDKVIVGGGE